MKNMKKKILTIVLGCIVIFAGVGYGMQALGYIEHFTLFFDGWWTFFIIIPAFLSLFERGSSKPVSALLLALGVGLLAWRQNWLDAAVFKLVLPVLAIIFGVFLVVSAFVGHDRKAAAGTCEPIYPEDGSLPDYSVSFGEISPNYNGQLFKGCRIDVAFGKATLDLRGAVMENDCSIMIEAAFSGVELLLPPNCKLDLHSSSQFGGTENEFVPSVDPEAYTVHVDADVSFSGLSIR